VSFKLASLPFIPLPFGVEVLLREAGLLEEHHERGEDAAVSPLSLDHAEGHRSATLAAFDQASHFLRAKKSCKCFVKISISPTSGGNPKVCVASISSIMSPTTTFPSSPAMECGFTLETRILPLTEQIISPKSEQGTSSYLNKLSHYLLVKKCSSPLFVNGHFPAEVEEGFVAQVEVEPEQFKMGKEFHDGFLGIAQED